MSSDWYTGDYDSLPYWIKIRINFARAQTVIKEADLQHHLNDGWRVQAQLNTGDIVVEKQLDVAKAAKIIGEQMARQIDMDAIVNKTITQLKDEAIQGVNLNAPPGNPVKPITRG